VLQLSHTGGFEWSLYSEFSEGFLVGFQANRNAEADFLLITMLAMGVIATTRLSDGRQHGMTWGGLLGGSLSIIVGLVMTGSRTGISLSILAILFFSAMWWPQLRKRRTSPYWLAGGAGAMVLGGALLLQAQAVQKVVARFSLTKDARWELWADTLYAMRRVWPFGSGIGTIVPMLEAAERLEVVDQTRPVRAHNDWLEWLLEAGLPGVIVLGLVGIVIGYLIVCAIPAATRSETPPARRAQILFGCGLLVIEALHAIVDYPMRSMSLAMLAAVAVAFLMEPAAAKRSRQ